MYPPTALGWLAGHSALLAAARLEAWDVGQQLLEKGADPAVEGPQPQVFSDLVRQQAKLYAEQQDDPATFTALLKAIKLAYPDADRL